MVTLLEPLLVQQYNSLRATAQIEGTLTNQAICNKHSTGSAAGRTYVRSAISIYMSDDAVQRQRLIRVKKSLRPSCTTGLTDGLAQYCGLPARRFLLYTMTLASLPVEP